jgi:hypothetical protein
MLLGFSRFPLSTTNDCGNWNWYGEAAYSFNLFPAGTEAGMRALMPGYRSKEETFLATIGPERESNFVLARE